MRDSMGGIMYERYNGKNKVCGRGWGRYNVCGVVWERYNVGGSVCGVYHRKGVRGD